MVLYPGLQVDVSVQVVERKEIELRDVLGIDWQL